MIDWIPTISSYNDQLLVSLDFTTVRVAIFTITWSLRIIDFLFPLYMDSGSTGKPKGVLHTCGGYMLYTSTTFKYVFDYRPGDVFWCTADVGWITGHSYVCYGPLGVGATGVMVSGGSLVYIGFIHM